MKKNIVSILITMAFVLFATTKHAISDESAAPPPQSGSLDFARLGGMTPSELQAELIKVANDRRTFEDQLLAQLRAPSSKQARLAAIYLLGYYRMESAVPDLSRIIDPHHNRGRDEVPISIPLLSEWPAADALVRIGGPAIPEMIHNLETSDKPEVKELSVWVLRSILGPSLAKAALRDAIAVQTGKDEKAVSRLNAAMGSIGGAPLPASQP